jgi:fucose permease
MENTRSDGSGISPERLFLGSQFALIATAVAFAVVAATMGAMKEHFVLTNEQVGWIAGAATWGFTISIFIFGPLCDALGMKFLLRLAFVGHALGVLIMVFADGFTMLFVGALTISLGNGLVEAACNPLVATIYPDKKTQMLNRFHVWFPGGIVIGGLASYLLDTLGIGLWQVKLGLVLIPTVIYGVLFLGQKFPATERLQSGISFGQMVKETVLRPLFLLLFLCMMMTASMELGPNRWVPAVLESVGIPGILVLVWINLLMAILRYYAGPVVHRLSPTGVLFASAIVSGLGLWWLSYTDSLAMALVAGTVFAVGVCYFWPTMLGVTSERVPKGGALALALMGGIGMAIVGLVTSPMMGKIMDEHMILPPERTLSALQTVTATFPELKANAKGRTGDDINAALRTANEVILEKATTGTLPEIQTANALRPAEKDGGQIAFRYVAPLSIILAVIFGILYFRDRAHGGYKVERLAATGAPVADDAKPETKTT